MEKKKEAEEQKEEEEKEDRLNENTEEGDKKEIKKESPKTKTKKRKRSSGPLVFNSAPKRRKTKSTAKTIKKKEEVQETPSLKTASTIDTTTLSAVPTILVPIRRSITASPSRAQTLKPWTKERAKTLLKVYYPNRDTKADVVETINKCVTFSFCSNVQLIQSHQTICGRGVHNSGGITIF